MNEEPQLGGCIRLFQGNESSFSHIDWTTDFRTWRDYRWVYQRYRFKAWQPLKHTRE